MKTVAAYTANLGIGVAYAPLAAIADGSMAITNNHLLLPKPLQLDYAYACGTTLTDVQMSSPSLRTPNLPDLYPIDAVAQPANDPNIMDYRAHPFTLPALEELVVLASNPGAAAIQAFFVLFLGDPTTPWDNRAPVYTVKCTAAITAVPLKWTAGLLTFTQALASGTYAVLGMWTTSATGIVARLVFPLASNYRPGVLMSSAYGKRGPFAGTKAPLGVMGTFVNTNPPQLEILCTAADAAQTVFLDIAKIA